MRESKTHRLSCFLLSNVSLFLSIRPLQPQIRQLQTRPTSLILSRNSRRNRAKAWQYIAFRRRWYEPNEITNIGELTFDSRYFLTRFTLVCLASAQMIWPFSTATLRTI